MNGTNILSTTLIKLVDFENGEFHTFLPSNIDITKLHEFLYGGIGNGVINQMNSIVLNEIKYKNELKCVFDDTTDTFTPVFFDCVTDVFTSVTNKSFFYHAGCIMMMKFIM